MMRPSSCGSNRAPWSMLPRFDVRHWLAVLLLVVSIATPALAEKWAFAVFSDNCSGFTAYRNVLNEIHHQTVNPERKYPPFDFVLACGDVSPAEENFHIFREAFNGAPPSYFPVRGNHERGRDVRFLLDRVLPLNGEKIRIQEQKGLNYYADWKNVRLIVLDQYSSFGKAFDGDAAISWLKVALQTRDRIRHVFVAFHEPYLPLRKS